MNPSWLRSVEKTVLLAREGNIRVLGVISAEPNNGVLGLGRAIAEISAHSGLATLLLDLSLPADGPVKGGWIPRPGHASQQITPDTAGFDVLFADNSPTSRLLFNNTVQLRSVIKGDLASYELVVATLAPVGDVPDDAINPVAAALACDAVVLAAALGRVSRSKLQQAMDAMQSAGVKFLGSIVFGVPATTSKDRGSRHWRRKRSRIAQVRR